MSKSKSKAKLIVSLFCLCLALTTVAATVFVFRPYYYETFYIAPTPTNLSSGWSNAPEPIFSDIYVSVNGNDNGDGSLERPFATIERAQKAVRNLKMEQLSHAVVAIMEGTYNIDSLVFTEKDSGTQICRVIYSSYGDGEVIFNGRGSEKAMLEVDGAEYIAFSGITFTNAKGTAIKLKGSNIDFSSCKLNNIDGNAIEIDGQLISINGCSFSDIGATAITISGGDREKLIPGNCSADNNLINGTSVINKAAPSVVIGGTGNAFTNNEIVNSPSTAVYYSGSANKIEYNYIHNTCLDGNGVFAVDSPMRWDCYGNFVRYNCISTLGNSENTPGAIRACSGSQIRGNMIINTKGVGIDFNGGRDINFTNNVLVNCAIPLDYSEHNISADNPAWKQLQESPYKSDVWASAFPDCSSLKTDYSSMSDPLFAANPANSLVENNIILQARANIGTLSTAANTLSVIDSNMVLEVTETDIFIDAKGGNYRINDEGEVPAILPEFRNIPFDSIGRY